MEPSKSIDNLCNEVDNVGASDNEIQIASDIVQPRRKCRRIDLNSEDRKILEEFGDELDVRLQQSAVKQNLSAVNVKSILRQVARNEHVVAMLRQTEEPANTPFPFEPKLTRAKAKELFFNQPVEVLPEWISPKLPETETKVLITEELPDEDDSEDDYLPNEDDDSDYDRDTTCLESEPATPHSVDVGTQTFADNDEFKMPTSVKMEEDAKTIALRTRSKLCLSDTRLEEIEKAFIPPDITTDMYDMECDDEEWKAFLKKFTQPLEDIVRTSEDDELDPEFDPEYNILADESINDLDEEELRAGRGVEVSKKELNELIAELFAYTDNFNTKEDTSSNKEYHVYDRAQQSELSKRASTMPAIHVKSNADQFNALHDSTDYFTRVARVSAMNYEQYLLLQQQMRQHVQLLTQNFMLTCDHPEFCKFAVKYKEYLNDLKSQEVSYPFNLNNAIDLVDLWELTITSDSVIANDYREHVRRVLEESKQYRTACRRHKPTFPKLFLDSVSISNVFLYPFLLPHAPFKSESVVTRLPWFPCEDQMMAIGLERFMLYASHDPYHKDRRNNVRLKHLCGYIHKFMLPARNPVQMYHRITTVRSYGITNPINYFFNFRKAPITLHYVTDIGQLEILPPCERDLASLPEVWKEHILKQKTSSAPVILGIDSFQTSTDYNKITPLCRISKLSHDGRQRRPITYIGKLATAPESSGCKQPNNSSNSSLMYISSHQTNNLNELFRPRITRLEPVNQLTEIGEIKFNSSIFSKMNEAGKFNHGEDECMDRVDSTTNFDFTNADDSSENQLTIEATKNSTDDSTAPTASSCTRPPKKCRVPISEKRKQKLQKEFQVNISMLQPENQDACDHKTNMYVQAFYDKLRDQLDLVDYQKLMEILNDFDDAKNTAQELYRNVTNILELKYPDIADEFLTFLTSEQAKSVGKLVPHFMLNNMSFFLRRLEMYFKEQPSQVRKIYQGLDELSAKPDVTLDEVKNTILPLLKGNSLIIDWFLQFLPSEKPNQRLLSGPWETVEVSRETQNNSDDAFEIITIPEVEDVYGGPTCICHCHESTDNDLKTRMRHCTSCGTKGRVYLQTGKGLRLANVTFEDDGTDNNARLACKTITTKRRSDSSPNKQISPNKDNTEDGRLSNESDDESVEVGKKKSKLLKIPRKRKIKIDASTSHVDHSKVKIDKVLVHGEAEDSNRPHQCKILVEHLAEPIEINDAVVEDSVDKDFHEYVQNRLTRGVKRALEDDEDEEIDGYVVKHEGQSVIGNTIHTGSNFAKLHSEDPEAVTELSSSLSGNMSIELMDLRVSPERDQSAESGSEETSQDNANSDTDSSGDVEMESNSSNSPQHSENSNTYPPEDIAWSRDEDKVILQTFQREGATDEAFASITKILQNRSIYHVKQRLDTLISLIRKMTD